MDMLSLYDYLGKPAGSELGREVAQAASKAGIKLETREVSNPKYTGIIYLYPKDFLDSHFKPVNDLPGVIDWSTKVLEDDDLPF